MVDKIYLQRNKRILLRSFVCLDRFRPLFFRLALTDVPLSLILLKRNNKKIVYSSDRIFSFETLAQEILPKKSAVVKEMYEVSITVSREADSFAFTLTKLTSNCICSEWTENNTLVCRIQHNLGQFVPGVDSCEEILQQRPKISRFLHKGACQGQSHPAI